MQVFVYGTLTDPDRARTVLGPDWDETELDGAAVLDGCHRVDGQYPTLAPGGQTEGRLLSVDEPALDRLDRYEGVDSGLYARVSIPRADGDDTVWTYVGDPARLDVDTPVDWPAGETLSERVRRYVTQAGVELRVPE